MSTVIRVESLSKRYRLGTIGRTALHEDLSRWWARLHGRPDPTLRMDQIEHLRAKHESAVPAADLRDDAEHVWALRDVGFDVQQGEVLGIIGRNGAGKSTLLKILTRVTAPTLGTVKMKGRVASLLEVGTGFHPELTGRENIYLNGTILGMTRAEVRRKFDDIVAFAELDKFIDTPVKRYSSGMYVRLAFAVAAHLDPEILLVDEVLAVGDAEFQKKCLGKMKDVAGQGRTVLFVSHNMGAVRRLCTQCIVLERGALLAPPGPPDAAVADYLGLSPSSAAQAAFHSDTFDLEAFRLIDADGNAVTGPCANDRLPSIEVALRLHHPAPGLQVGYSLYDETGELLYMTFSTDTHTGEWPRLEPGRNVVRSAIPSRMLNEGRYRLVLLACVHNAEWLIHPSRIEIPLSLTVEGGLSDSPCWYTKRPGWLAPVLPWTRQE